MANGICAGSSHYTRPTTTKLAHTWDWARMRRYAGPCNAPERSPPHQSYLGCTIVTRGSDFRERQAFAATSRSIDEFLASAIPFRPIEIRNVTVDAALAAELRCEPGRQFLLFRGIRKLPTQPDEPALTLTNAYIAASYSAILPYLSELTGTIAGTAERVFGIQVRNIVEELEPILIDAETAVVVDAPAGSPAMLVRRWYSLDGEVILLISRSIYPKGRMLFRNELHRSEVPRSPTSEDFSGAKFGIAPNC
jgi:hypothetical protein